MSALAILMFGFSLLGCAQITATRIDPALSPGADKTKGIRYWLAMPYLLVREAVEIKSVETLGRLDPDTGQFVPKGGSLRDAPGAVPPLPEALPQPAPLLQSDKIAVVWLPDYCHQYAVDQVAVLSYLKTNIKLADGWKLDSAESEADTDELAGKLVEAIGNVQAAKAGQQPQAAPPGMSLDARSVPSAAAYLRKITTTRLKPGLYPLMTRDNNDCRQPVRFSSTIPSETSERYEVLALTPK